MDGRGVSRSGSGGQPYVNWLTQTAAAPSRRATQAHGVGGGVRGGVRGIVPPAAIAANRAQLATLVATNFLGINMPAIAATEAQYAE